MTFYLEEFAPEYLKVRKWEQGKSAEVEERMSVAIEGQRSNVRVFSIENEGGETDAIPGT